MISIVVPVYNEENAIVQTVRDIVAAMEGFREYEIIVVNDGSADRSGEKLAEANIPKVSIISHVENLGYGKSLFDGIVAAKYNCVVTIDADGSYPAMRIRDLCGYYPDYDMVVGARKGKEFKKGLFKRPARILFNYIVQYASGREVPDANSGLRMFKKDIVLQFRDSLCTGFSFTTTLTLIFLLNHFYVKFLPIEYMKRVGRSKVRHFKDTLRAAQIIVEAFLYYNPIKLFLLIASANAAFGLFLGILNHFILQAGFVTIFCGALMASFVPIFCVGLIADQLKKIYNVGKGERK